MSELADKTSHHSEQGINSGFEQEELTSPLCFQDNRPEALEQRQLHNLANNSPQIRQLRAFQEMASGFQASRNHFTGSPIQRMTFPEYEAAAKMIQEAPSLAYSFWEQIEDDPTAVLAGIEELRSRIKQIYARVEEAGDKTTFRHPLMKFAQSSEKAIMEYIEELESRASSSYQRESFLLDRQIEREEELDSMRQTGVVKKNAPMIEGRIGEQQKGLQEHDKTLVTEASSGNKNIHGRGRHGFQTGVEGQIRRASNKKTPDQPSDEMGLGRTINSWTSSEGVEMINAPTSVHGNKIVEGQAVSRDEYEKGGKKKKASKDRKSGGPYAGSFFSPEHQNKLITSAIAKANEYLKWDQAEFEGDGWKTIEYFDVVLQDQKGGYGVSFSKGKGKESPYVLKIKDSPLVQEHEGMDVYLMLCAKVQLKRKGNEWEVLSSFPENLAPGASPIYKHGDDPWTGKVKNSQSSEEATFTPPKWHDE